MFIKIVRGNRESLYECHSYSIDPEGLESIRTVDGKPFTIHMEGGGNISVQIDKSVPEAMAVYAMSDSGKTIDTIFYKTKTVNAA